MPKAAWSRPATSGRASTPSRRPFPASSGRSPGAAALFGHQDRGRTAYDIARDGEEVELEARPVEVHSLAIVETPDPDHTVFAAQCGKGTYVRAIARDMGRLLGCRGHVSALRRTAVGPFTDNDMITLEKLESLCHRAAAGEVSLADALMPIATALDDIPAVAVSRADAARLHGAKPS